LQGLPRQIADPNLLVGYGTADDAAVYRLDAERALVFTVDIITPIVDDPHTWGAIAATNAISDVFAMGGRPLLALNVACFSPDLAPDVYRAVLAGASEAARRDGCWIVGGHTIKDRELKFGLAVIGEVHPDKILSNAGARAGDSLVLTKALGSAAIASSLKSGALDESSPCYAAMVSSMLQSNGPAASILADHDCHALTDITGFGLSGHGLEMARASGVGLRIDAATLPALPGALELLAAGASCGGGRSNAERVRTQLAVHPRVSQDTVNLLHDPQTSGPLLAALPAAQAEAACRRLRQAGYVHSRIIGAAENSTGIALRLD
jgi:selenide,water dikinase